jgi:hypothetical protein
MFYINDAHFAAHSTSLFLLSFPLLFFTQQIPLPFPLLIPFPLPFARHQFLHRLPISAPYDFSSRDYVDRCDTWLAVGLAYFLAYTVM